MPYSAATGQLVTERALQVPRATVVAAHREALARGEGVAYVDGEFLAIDIVAMAERIIARARQVEARDKGGS